MYNFLLVVFMNRLKELREARKMKQMELAGLLKVTRQAVSRYELGDRDMNPEIIALACSVFGVTADYLLGLSTQRTAQISDDDAELLAAYRRAPDSIRAGIDALLEPYREKKEAEGL